MADQVSNDPKIAKVCLRSFTEPHDHSSSTATRSMATISNGGSLSHRSSFAENLRNHPPSPRSQRHPSFTQAQVQELLNHPPMKSGDARFAGRDWRQIRVGELVTKEHVRFVELDTGVEEATKVGSFSIVAPH
jgi:hypothetical protein